MVAVLVLFSLIQLRDVPERPKFVPESGPHYSISGDTLELRGARGWLRTDRALVDFDLEFEFRAVTPEIDAGVVVRSWTGNGYWPNRGYRLNLPLNDSEVEKLFTARRQNVTVLHRGRVDLHPAGEWQKVQVAAEGSRIRLTINDTLAGEFEVARMRGLVLLENRTGTMQLRKLMIRSRPINSTIPGDAIRFEQLKAAAGRVPRVVREIKPEYTTEAMSARVEGVVKLEALVGADGEVGPVRVSRSLDPGLDLNAVAAMRGWKFTPGTMNGVPVPVVVEVEMEFTLK